MSDVKLETVFENEKVNVTKVSVPDGWVGEHTHPGNQMVITLSPASVTYKQNGEEFSKEYNIGDVIWLDDVTHDHATVKERTYLMVTLK